MTTVDGAVYGTFDTWYPAVTVHGASGMWGGWSAAEVSVGATGRHGTAQAVWGGWDAEATVSDTRVGVAVYDAATGKVFQSGVATSKPTYRVELSQRGSGKLMCELTDPGAAHLTDRAIVKMTFRGRTEAFRVNGEAAVLAKDGKRWLTFDNMPSLVGCLHDGPIYPEGGLPAVGVIDKDAPTTRAFGPMSPRGPWYVAPDWVRPMGVLVSADTIRRGYPKELGASVGDVWWIAPSPGPEADQAEGTVAHFRREFTVTANTSVEFMFTADNYLSLWLDGQEIIAPDYAAQYTWRKVYTWQGILTPGPHVIYARVENARRSGGLNPLGLVGAVFKQNRQGEHAGVLIHTHPAYWWATTQEVGWYAGQMLHQVISESQQAGDAGPSMLALTFDQHRDSDGLPWSGTRLTKQFNVMTDMVDDAVSMLSQDGLDVVADARGMTLGAYNRYGEDRSGSVRYRLGDDSGNLVQYDPQTTGTRATVGVAQLSDNRWHTVQDDVAVAAFGRIVLPVQLGTTTSPESAEVTMRQMLAETAKPVTAVTAKPHVLVGVQFLRDAGLGDSVLAPGRRMVGTVKERAYAYTVDGSKDIADVWPDLVEDPT